MMMSYEFVHKMSGLAVSMKPDERAKSSVAKKYFVPIKTGLRRRQCTNYDSVQILNGNEKATKGAENAEC